MRRTTVITAALLALSLAPALQAQRWGDRDSNRYRYPQSGQMERVAVLAHEIEDVAASIHRQAARNNRRPDRDVARVLADLHQLEERADHFHGQVESYRQDPRHTRDDFAALEEAFYETADSLRYIQPRPYIDRGMDRIYDLMNELSRYYGRSGYGRWGDRGRDRYGYGHDRYDRRYGRDRYDDDDHDDGHGHRPPLKH
ncbi:MAG TPA: hypothetical protein VGG03_08365 [Thermoanaerobaculia bacterium]|jgi:hypothetical protein